MPFLYEKTQYRGEDCVEITGHTSASGILTIPDTIEGLPVRSIGKHAFAAGRDLQEVSLPPTLKRLSRFAFHNCGNLKKIAQHSIHVAVDNMQIVEDLHMIVDHVTMYVFTH